MLHRKIKRPSREENPESIIIAAEAALASNEIEEISETAISQPNILTYSNQKKRLIICCDGSWEEQYVTQMFGRFSSSVLPASCSSLCPSVPSVCARLPVCTPSDSCLVSPGQVIFLYFHQRIFMLSSLGVFFPRL
jgi:hypothetical protein